MPEDSENSTEMTMADYSVLCENQQIEIGKAGENLARSCTIDYSAWLKEYGEGDLRIRAIRSGDAEPYPVTNVATENGVATWTFTDADTAVKGYGEVQILYYVEDVLVKSGVWRTYTHRSLYTSSEEVPDPYQDWLSEVERIGSQIEDDAESASDSATRAAGSASEAAESALSAARSESSAQEYASEASTSATSAASSASAASQSASEASTYEYYSEQYMNEAKSARFSAESAKNAAETAKTAAQTAATESEASATAAAQSAEQAEEAAESIEESADLIQKLMDNQIKDTATGTIATYPDGADMPMVSLVADIDPIQDLHGYDRPWVGGAGANVFEPFGGTGRGIVFTPQDDGTVKIIGTVTQSGWPQVQKDCTLEELGWSVGDEFYNYVGSNEQIGCAVRFLDGNGTQISQISSNASGAVPQGTATVRFIQIGARGTAPSVGDVINTVGHFYVCRGTTAPTEWTPYSNICPISGWDSVDVSVCGANIWDEEWESGGIRSSDGTNSTDANRIRAKNLIPIVETTYYVKAPSNLTAFYYDMNNDFMESKPIGSNATFIPINGAKYMRFTVGSSSNPVTTYNHDISINYPSTDTEYHAYQGQTITTTLPQTVYGGTLDVVSGVLTVDRVKETYEWSNGAGAWTLGDYTRKVFKTAYASVMQYSGDNIQICDCLPWKHSYVEQSAHFYVDTGNAGSNNCVVFMPNSVTSQTLNIVYGLATPTTIQLTTQQIDSLLGRNNVWADSGDVTVEYIADTKLYIQKVMGAIG